MLHAMMCAPNDEALRSVQDYALGQLEQNSKLRARQLCNALQSLGPSFVKIGQALSSRPDLLPQIYLEVRCFVLQALPGHCHKLEKYQDLKVVSFVFGVDAACARVVQRLVQTAFVGILLE
jgi:predicted unusual protein kinase regulating ubiquinone biosynthesis (AarF/ABC1/UbiB family)